MVTPPPAPATAPTTTPTIIAWTTIAADQSTQCYIWVSAAVSTRIDTHRAATLSADPAELRQQAIALQRLLPSDLSTWASIGFHSHEHIPHLLAKRDDARSECEEHMSVEGRLQQRLANAEVIMNCLARSDEPSAVPQSTSRAEKIADSARFDGT